MTTVAATWRECPAVPPKLTDPLVEAVVGDTATADRLWQCYQDTGPWVEPEGASWTGCRDTG